MGIEFRSGQHLAWFAGTVLVLGGALVATAWILVRRGPADDRRVLGIFLSLVGAFHVAVSLEAARRAWRAIHVTHTDPNGPVFSVDCIWFNALVAGAYGAALWLLWRSRRRPLRAPRPA